VRTNTPSYGLCHLAILTLRSPGDQYKGDVTNPFEERVVNGFTALEIATLQSRLNKQLGPEYISQRPGNGGGRVAYLEGNKAIALANEVFGFNGWSSSLGQVQIDFVGWLPVRGICRN
jgi:recombination DNA repair RAD52 pathway protein